MSDKKKLPGVILYLKSERRYQVENTQKAEISLECTIEDDNVWGAVEKMFVNGFKVYTSADFKDEMIDVFKEEVKQLEADLFVHKYERERYAKQCEYLERQLAHYKGLFDDFNKAIGGKT